MLANSGTNLQELLNKVVVCSRNISLELNVTKTECMVSSKKEIPPKCTLKVGNDTIKQVNQFKYLGYTLTSDGRSDSEIKKENRHGKKYLQRTPRNYEM